MIGIERGDDDLADVAFGDRLAGARPTISKMMSSFTTMPSRAEVS